MSRKESSCLLLLTTTTFVLLSICAHYSVSATDAVINSNNTTIHLGDELISLNATQLLDNQQEPVESLPLDFLQQLHDSAFELGADKLVANTSAGEDQKDDNSTTQKPSASLLDHQTDDMKTSELSLKTSQQAANNSTGKSTVSKATTVSSIKDNNLETLVLSANPITVNSSNYDTSKSAIVEVTTVTQATDANQTTGAPEVSDANNLPTNAQSKIPFKCVFFDWQTWSPCNAPCGGGLTTRTRLLQFELSSDGNITDVENCPSSRTLSRQCNVRPCPIDCLVTAWTVWTNCNCTTGISVRRKFVLQKPEYGGRNCPNTLEAQDCKATCAKDCLVSEWSGWSKCSVDCGNGFRQRNRRIVRKTAGNGLTCPPLDHIQSCILPPCAPKGSICANRPNGLYGDPHVLCSSRFLVCDTKQEYWRFCHQPLVYNPATKQCNHRHQINECSAINLHHPRHEKLASHNAWAIVGMLSCVGIAVAILLCFIKVIVSNQYRPVVYSPAPSGDSAGFHHLDVVATPPPQNEHLIK